MAWLDGLDRKPLAASHRNHVADFEMLTVRKDTFGTRTIQEAEQAVEPVVAVQPASPITHLHEPRPDIRRSCLDRDGERCFVARIQNATVTEHRTIPVHVGGAPTPVPASDGKPVQKAGHDEREKRHQPESHDVPFWFELQFSCSPLLLIAPPQRVPSLLKVNFARELAELTLTARGTAMWWIAWWAIVTAAGASGMVADPPLLDRRRIADIPAPVQRYLTKAMGVRSRAMTPLEFDVYASS